MKKILLLAAVLFTFGNLYSQVKLGLNFNPGLLINRIQNATTTDSLSYGKNGAGLKFSVGPDIYVMFSDNAAITFGLWYTAKRVGVKTTKTDPVTSIKTTAKDVYNLQYVQLPVTLRMYTNEIATDLKLYFMVGGTADVRLKTKDKTIPFDAVKKFGTFDAGILAGAGVEFTVGENTHLLAGLRYNRGLINNVSKVRQPDGEKVKINSDFISLDLGIRF